MNMITIEIPKKILANQYRAKRLILVEPAELTKEARRRLEFEEAKEASLAGRREWREGKTREIKDLKELM